ncbi:hypothetical protein FACS1894199_17730 [Bacteroidia bacterium]|nr:hypothetical protein FACS1894199_17730 [Bacteroidia bacterium]
MLIEFNDKKIFAFADTHGKHRDLVVPVDADILVCAGDVCDAGDEAQLVDFFAWFEALPARHKLFVPGNHDLPFELVPHLARTLVPQNVEYVEEGGFMMDGIRFYVLPVRMYMYSPVEIPYRVDVLVTHGAPWGIFGEDKYSCSILREVVDEAQPRIHLFGHIHNHGGETLQVGKTLFCNVAVT